MFLGARRSCALATVITTLLIVSIAHVDANRAQTQPTTTGINPDAVDDAKPAVTHAPSLCEARTINYITHYLPQSCLTTSWVDSRLSTAEQSEPGSAKEHDGEYATAAASSESQPTEAAVSSFMSFEDWKEMMLRQAGQDPQEWRSRKASHHPHEKQPPDAAHHADLGDEEEISLNFGNYQSGDDREPADDQLNGERTQNTHSDETLVYGDAVAHRSKDAGKTCKERFSYSSFDAGATVLKTAPGAKNARAILVENKDTYMLLECAATSKYVIVELSDDILIDTIVLANFEFFSSMIRHFRVSVSDRYPVKTEKWRDLGVFEARNSRDIQPFLVENPQIWAKYVKIEFMSHYGKEYYCPVSLLRVHGSRMLDSWKESETSRDEDPQLEGSDQPQNATHDQTTSMVTVSSRAGINQNATQPSDMTPWTGNIVSEPFRVWIATCPVDSSSPTRSALIDRGSQRSPRSIIPRGDSRHEDATQAQTMSPRKHDTPVSDDVFPPSSTPTSSHPIESSRVTGARPATDVNYDGNVGNHAGSIPSETARDRSNNATAATTSSRAPAMATAGGKPRSNGASGSNPASPAVQEGFFNAITKRLQQVESNLTLSLKYVEEQSRHVQEALLRGEQKQNAKVSLFLDNLNRTVLSELRNIRDQYDQIWQSTILALESQSERAERDMMALSARLNLLADEVVFQKRMAIVQAVILLSCLSLVIFSRGVPASSLVTLPSQVALSGLLEEPLNTNMYGASEHGQRGQRGQQSRMDEPHGTYPRKEGLSPSSRQTMPNIHPPDDPHAMTEYRRLSPPLTPSQADQTEAVRSSSTHHEPHDTAGDHPRHLPCVPQIGSRKPLPSLPEHPPSPPNS
ncbi:hypothetical protein HIM_04444 [Hirsutella minnesotensis 3608]|uniref:SUN domain-containing protein n=1 Tax=Hirsutella minnesotensis 3608 TaxID=1043627 RepID=A0A0F7ZV48_9HYPO|nr:hypothetical protein HIM_04444 [Hirsutella minnesotensis 3608]